VPFFTVFYVQKKYHTSLLFFYKGLGLGLVSGLKVPLFNLFVFFAVFPFFYMKALVFVLVESLLRRYIVTKYEGLWINQFIMLALGVVGLKIFVVSCFLMLDLVSFLSLSSLEVSDVGSVVSTYIDTTVTNFNAIPWMDFVFSSFFHLSFFIFFVLTYIFDKQHIFPSWVLDLFYMIVCLFVFGLLDAGRQDLSYVFTSVLFVICLSVWFSNAKIIFKQLNLSLENQT
jgi:hypothetical protein